MNRIQKNLVKYGKTSDINKLQAFVSSLSAHEICTFISSVITSSEVAQYLHYLFQGFEDTKTANDNRQQVIKHILEQIGSLGIVLSTDLQGSIIRRICADLKRLPTSHLVELASLCVDMIHMSNSKTNMIWEELLPALMSLLSNQPTVRHNSVDMTGLEFKTQIINALCIVRWPNDIVISLANMFMQLQLSKEDHNKICSKLSSKIFDLEPSSLPPFIHQLLLLCEVHNNIGTIFAMFDYFSVRLHKDSEANSNSEESDLNSIGSDLTELQHAEQTVLFHIHSLVTSSSHCGWITNFLNVLRTVNKWPEFVLRTFTIMLLLVMASVKDFKQSTIYDVIKIAIYRKIKYSVMCKESAWLRETIKGEKSLDDLILNIIETSVKESIMVTEGLMGLAFHLLSYSGDCEQQIYKIGVLILLKLSKKQQKYAPIILEKLLNEISTADSEVQYSYCLSSMVEYIPFILIQSQQNKTCVLNTMFQAPELFSKRVLKSIIPLVKFSSSLRDQLMLIFRKLIFASDHTSNRQMGVFGLCLLVENLKIKLPNSASLSQQTLRSRNSSAFTQIGSSIEKAMQSTYNSSSYENICLEILSTLQRSLMKQYELKVEIYTGLQVAVCKNPPVCYSTLAKLSPHLHKYITTQDGQIQIAFNNLVNVVDDAVSVVDSLGHLLTCITLILAKAKDIERSSDDNILWKKIQDTLNSLCVTMGKHKLSDYGLGEEFNLSDGDLESGKKIEVWKQVIMVQESLIIYKTLMWSSESDSEQADTILCLFKAYKTFFDYSKTVSKTKKGSKNKDLSKNSSKSQNSQSDSPTLKFKTPKTLLTLPILNKVLSLLYTDSNENSKCLKANRDFHHFTLQILLGILQDLISTKDMAMHGKRKRLVQDLSECGSIIYENCVCKLETLVDFDLTTAVYTAEAMYNLFNCIDNHEKIGEFLSALYPNHKQANLQELLNVALLNYKEILNTYLKSDTELPRSLIDKDSKIAVSLINSVYILCKYISLNGPLAIETLEWIRLIAVDIKNDTEPIAKAFLALLIRFDNQVKITSNLCENSALQVCSLLGTINEEEIDCPNRLSLITECTVLTVIQNLCDNCSENLYRADWTVQYINSYYTALVNGSTDQNCDSNLEYLKEKESFVCAHFCNIINIANTLSNAQIPTGVCSNSLLKILSRLYISLSNLTKYFIKRTSSSPLAFLKARFEKVVKLAGKKLFVTLYRFIPHIEEVQESKKRNKVVQQTRLIPNLIFAMENFRTDVLKLSGKTNESAKEILITSMNVGTTRDFRLKLTKLQEAVNNTTNDETNLTDDNGTVISETELENESESESSETPSTKRKRTS